jgi:hypothetical protein
MLDSAADTLLVREKSLGAIFQCRSVTDEGGDD